MVDAVPAAEADGEVSPADAKVVDPAPTETPAVTAAAPAKVVPKPDKPRTAKPDRTELEATIVILQEACDVNQARIEELKRKIETKRDSRKTINAGTQGTRARITELNGSFTAHMVSARYPPAIAEPFAVLSRHAHKLEISRSQLVKRVLRIAVATPAPQARYFICPLAATPSSPFGSRALCPRRRTRSRARSKDARPRPKPRTCDKKRPHWPRVRVADHLHFCHFGLACHLNIFCLVPTSACATEGNALPEYSVLLLTPRTHSSYPRAHTPITTHTHTTRVLMLLNPRALPFLRVCPLLPFNATKKQQDTRNAIRKELIAVDSIRERMKEQVLAMKQKLKFFTVEAIDREISKLEEHHAHTSMSLQEEKKIMTQLKDLSRSRETVREYNDAQAKISGEDGNRKAIIERIRAKDLEINAVKAEQQQYRATLDAVRSQEEKAGADIPQMQEERNASYEIIKAKRDEIRRLRTEFKATEDEYWTTEQLWRAYLKVEKQKQWEATVEERKARDEARKQWEIENAPEPFEAEVAAAEQLIAYLAKWDPKSNKAAEEKAAEEAAAVAAKRADAFKGLKIMNKKMLDEPEEDDLFSLSGTSKGKKAKKKQRVAAEEPQGPNPKERLNISFDAYAHFSKLSLTAPSLVGEVPAMMNSLKEKKELFLEKRKIKKERIAAGLDVEDERKEKEEREAAAAAKREKRESNKKGKDKKEKGAEPDAEAEGAAEADVDQITAADAEGGGKDAEGPTVTVSLEAMEDGVKVTLSTEKEAEAKEE